MQQGGETKGLDGAVVLALYLGGGPWPSLHLAVVHGHSHHPSGVVTSWTATTMSWACGEIQVVEFESAALSSQFLAYKPSLGANHARQGVIISPNEVISREEADRLEGQWNKKFPSHVDFVVKVCDVAIRLRGG